jgi:GTP-binding protein
MLLDEVRVEVTSGHGGRGLSTFLQEKHTPKGGPDGGNGGKGGDVILKVNPNFNTLLDLGYSRTFRAEDGHSGGTNKCTGRCGKHFFLEVPVGTLVKDEEGNILADLTAEGQEWVAAKGGIGGRGNSMFKGPNRQTPTHAEEGRTGEHRILHLELKMMADVGLVGFPNAGKSSLVNKISSGRPKVGDYPFTTLAPVLGIVKMSGYGAFVIADIPGLIEGASEGKGLGHQFLRHIERTSVLLFVIDGFAENALEQYRTLERELEAFHHELTAKPRMVALNKSDLGVEAAQAAFEAEKVPYVLTSAITGAGCRELIRALEAHVRPAVDQRKGAW